ncbi:LysR family transcriptional regulator [Rummeliibacillus suwonensis]|uniref:LysR family transcriptional regulator n=1 Tax=Rummeliibacillus suwonensis TaxID=1306154 RepID=UPI0011B824EA|nr:LysR family transcriptional regulator [Rummeliibacillus suwonensis]
MDIRYLSHFITIVQEGVNMSKAARKLHISQPPLSQQMKIIEETLGVKIFERRGKKISLTPSGDILYKRAMNIVNLYEELQLEMFEMGQGVKGHLTISVSIFYSTIFQSSIVFDRIKAFCKDYPNVKIKIVHTDGTRLVERMEVKEIDLAILNLPIQEEIFDFIRLEKQNFSFIMPANLDHDHYNDQLKFEDIEKYPLILLKRDIGYGLYEKVLEHCAKFGFEPNLVAESNNINTIISMVDAGMGTTILPISTLKQFKSKNLKVMEFSDTQIFSESVLMYLKDRYLSKTASEFLKYF